MFTSNLFSYNSRLLMDKTRGKALGFSSAFLLVSSCVFSYIISPSLSVAQEFPGCFMKDASGRMINLNLTICNNNPNPLPSPSSETPSPETSSPSPSSRVFQVKIKRRLNNIPIIDVKFNGKQSFEMMVDSGASGTVITPAIAKALGVTPIGEMVAQTPSGKSTFPIGRISSMSVGGLEVKDVEVGIANTLPVGLLGHDFFGDKDLTIKENIIEFRTRQ